MPPIVAKRKSRYRKPTVPLLSKSVFPSVLADVKPSDTS
jgi:hypothetical protein